VAVLDDDDAAVLDDDDAAALYDAMYPWGSQRWPADGFYNELVMAADSVLDVGCGTGGMLAMAREHGHTGLLVGLDPDRAALARARRREDVQWVDGTAAGAPWQGTFDLATMTGHAFQCLITDRDVRESLAAIHTALRPGGRFAFETRHPQARAWEAWNPSNVSDVTGPAGRPMLMWHEVESVAGDVITMTETAAAPDGKVLRVDRAGLRFLGSAALDAFLADAGLEIEARYGDWQRGPMTGSSREIITIARRD
jgi:SAM-dependent methyltransferase